ncbi:DUF4363 family protein [Clostridium sp.]|uniref:DUF4363 family protein n=1 Tax=Clostridium sp. TaxID=1506 RepID=UPI002A9183CF|nr:DUF4363 family protein [Clostridium sp.]MDY6013076.1 DUF4363 family protein [Clostridium sp.]
MKNSIVSLILFFSAIIFIFFANSELIKLCDQISNDSDRIERLLDDKKWDESYNESVKLLKKLDESNSISSIYISHIELDAIVDQTVRLTVLIKSRDESESLATLHLIRYNAERIKELQYPSIENILIKKLYL